MYLNRKKRRNYLRKTSFEERRKNKKRNQLKYKSCLSIITVQNLNRKLMIMQHEILIDEFKIESIDKSEICKVFINIKMK